MHEWDVSIPPGGTWRRALRLPVDAEFVGFVTPPASLATSLRITPLWIVDKSNREATSTGSACIVLSAVRLSAASMFFHDEDVYPERTGFWVHGESTASMTVAPQTSRTRRHASRAQRRMPNTVTFATHHMGERVELRRHAARGAHPAARSGLGRSCCA